MTIYLNSVVEVGLLAGGGAAVAFAALAVKEKLRFMKLDAGPSHVFRTAAECQQRGFDQRFALMALGASSERNSLYCFGYEAWEKDHCIARHGEHYRAVPVPHVSAAEAIIPETFRYVPQFGGFQVLANNPRSAEPLYKTHDPDVLMRRDGKTFHIPQPA